MGVGLMKDWTSFGGNDTIDSMFEENPNPQYRTQDEIREDPIESETLNDDQYEQSIPVEKKSRKHKKVVAEKLTEYRSAKYPDRQITQLEHIKLALGTTNDGEALRWALDAAYKANKKRIERIVEEKERIESL